jgi:hypothetical protein
MTALGVFLIYAGIVVIAWAHWARWWTERQGSVDTQDYRGGLGIGRKPWPEGFPTD